MADQCVGLIRSEQLLAPLRPGEVDEGFEPKARGRSMLRVQNGVKGAELGQQRGSQVPALLFNRLTMAISSAICSAAPRTLTVNVQELVRPAPSTAVQGHGGGADRELAAGGRLTPDDDGRALIEGSWFRESDDDAGGSHGVHRSVGRTRTQKRRRVVEYGYRPLALARCSVPVGRDQRNDGFAQRIWPGWRLNERERVAVVGVEGAIVDRGFGFTTVPRSDGHIPAPRHRGAIRVDQGYAVKATCGDIGEACGGRGGTHLTLGIVAPRNQGSIRADRKAVQTLRRPRRKRCLVAFRSLARRRHRPTIRASHP